jgi:hypothetical protein
MVQAFSFWLHGSRSAFGVRPWHVPRFGMAWTVEPEHEHRTVNPEV